MSASTQSAKPPFWRNVNVLRFLAQIGARAEEAGDTAGAASEVAEARQFTRAALASFQRDMGIGGDGTLANAATRSVLVAHREIGKELTEPLPGEDILLSGRSGKEIRVLQRILKLLGRYEGEIDGLYDDALMSSVFQFQRDKNIVGSLTDVGAGMLGPQTRRALLTAWRDHRITKRGGGTMVAGIDNQL